MKFSEAIAKVEEHFDWLEVISIIINSEPKLIWFDFQGSYNSQPFEGSFALTPQEQGQYIPFEIYGNCSPVGHISLKWDGSKFVPASLEDSLGLDSNEEDRQT